MSLTKKQKQVYDYICHYLEENGFSPTQAEIQEHFGFKSLGSVQDYIRYLKGSGYLTSDPNSVRGLMPTNIDKAEESVPLPLHGKVAAGRPIEAIEGNEFINVPPHMIGHGEHYALTISGDSMIEDGIFDGDTVVIKSQKTAHNGNTVVAVIDNEATIKRFYRTKGQIELHPANEKLSPIVVKDGQLEIKGVLVGLLRSY
jgi:repressor LexA